MDTLWAPWRMAYVTTTKAPADDCFLCRCPKEDNDRENLVALRTPFCSVILNRFPYNNGHLLIAPLTHKARLDELTPEEMLDCVQTITKIITTLDALMRPDGYNVGLNLGKAAGAGLPGHLHWHVVPRWNGDTNFMTVTSDTRVIVQSLETLWELLRQKWHEGSSL